MHIRSQGFWSLASSTSEKGLADLTRQMDAWFEENDVLLESTSLTSKSCGKSGTQFIAIIFYHRKE